MNSSDYNVTSRNPSSYPEKMNESTNVPSLLCRDVKQTKRRFNCANGSTFTSALGSSAGQELRIPIAGNFVLSSGNINFNTTLQFTATAGATVTADFSWFNLFSQIRIEAGSGSSIILEQIDDVGLLNNILSQWSWQQEDISRENAKQGSMQGQPDINGLLAKAGAAITVINGTSGGYDISLDLSQIMGLFTCSLPLYDTAGLTVVLTLNQFGATSFYPYTAVVAAVGPPVVVASNTSIVTSVILAKNFISCNCLEAGEEYEKDLKKMKNSPRGEISVMFNTCRRYIQSLAGSGAAVSAQQLLINERAKSCLGFLATCRTSADLVDFSKYKNSSSGWDVYQNHLYNIAGQQYPMAGIASVSEAIDEAYDVIQHLSRKPSTVAGLLSRTQASPATAYVAGVAAGTAITVAGASGPAGILCVNLSKCHATEETWGKGLNLSGSNLSNYLQVSFSPPALSTINVYSIFQMKVHIDKMGQFSTEF